jgi:hypothetical protein
MLDAFESLRPQIGKELKATIAALESNDSKADAFLAELLRSNTSKGQFAQELAALLEDASISFHI